jgi:uncharacterized repeat protein (TIGR01451 family)
MEASRRLVVVVILALVVLTVNCVNPSPGMAAGVQPEEHEAIRLLSLAEDSVVVEALVPWDRLRVDPVLVDGSEYVEVSIPDWAGMSQAGAPALPVLVTTLAVPFGVELGLEIQPGEEKTISLPADILPAPTLSAVWDWSATAEGNPVLPSPSLQLVQDPAVYGSNHAFPDSLAVIVSDGLVRQQRVVGIAIYPVQYRPISKQITVYHSLTVRVDLKGDVEGGPAVGPESAVFRRLFDEELINSRAAREWVVEPSRTVESEAIPWSPPVPGYRVYVHEEGIYKLTYQDLLQAGVLNGDPDPRTFRLYNQGQEVAIHVQGQGDGKFNTGDYVLFYGKALESKYTPYNVYWLTHGGGTGRRMATRNGQPTAGTTPSFHRDKHHIEVNKLYIPGLPGDENLERYIWSYLYPPSRPSWSHTFSLLAPAGGAHTAKLEVSMYGFLENAIDPDHHTKLYLNGTLVEDALWDGITWRLSSVEFDQSLLTPGNNTIALQDPNDTGVGTDVVHIDWVALEFANTFQTAEDTFAFVYDQAGTWKYVVEGFTTNTLSAFDVTDPAAVVRITGAQTVPSGEGFSLSFSDNIAASTEYRIAAESQYLSAAKIELDVPSSLHSTANGADYVIVTHAAFADAIADLASYRASQGQRVVQVDVQDAYDEFGYGIVGAQPIQAFLKYAYQQWQRPAPTYVLLVGDGHYDPKDYEGYGRTSFLPPYLAPVDPWLGETAGDNRYVSLTAGDHFPDMILGRLAVSTEDQLRTIVDKTLNYDEDPVSGTWREHALFVADNRDQAGDFAQMSTDMIDCCLPQPYQPTSVFLGDTHETPAQAKAAIIDGINAGQLIVNYMGHAGVNGWAAEAVFVTDDIPSLTNGQKLPIMLPMTCYDGYYHYPLPPRGDSMAESLVRTADKGAVASWSPTGLGVAHGHDHLNQGFFDAVFKEGERVLGEATMAGKLQVWATGGNLDLIDTYTLFGDPALRIHALDADLQVDIQVTPDAPVFPGDLLTYSLTFRNNGPATAHGVVLADLVPASLVNPAVVYSSPEVLGARPSAPFTWDIADLAPGDGGEIRFRATVAADAGRRTIVNAVQISGVEPELSPSDNSAMVTAVVTDNPDSVDLRILKSVEPAGAVLQGDMLTYTLTFANAGPGIAREVVISDLVPKQLRNATVIAKSSNVVRQHDGVHFMWGIADLAAGESGEIRIRAQVDPDAVDGTVENDAEITTSSVDPNPGNNLAWVSTIVGRPRFHSYLPLVSRHRPLPPVTR